MKQLLYYNIGLIRSLDLINNKQEPIEEFLSPNHKELYAFYEKHKMNMNPVYDRTGNTPHFLNIKPGLLQIPKIDAPFNKSFRECVESRCKELVEMEKPITVVWSGGIDSTLALFALLRYVDDPKQITVYGTYSSILESGSLFDSKIKNSGVNYKFKVSSTRDFDDGDPNSIFVTGYYGNQLFGPVDDFITGKIKTPISFFHHQFNNDDPLIDYTKCIDDELHEFLLPSIKASPKKIETLRDLRWWLIFNFDWYTAEYSSRISTKQQNNQYHFYNTDDFQRYVITTKEPFTKDVGKPLTHRWVMRELIEEYSGDSYYAWNKPKGVSSLGNPLASWLFLLEDYSVYYANRNTLSDHQEVYSHVNEHMGF